ncbi:TIGR02679 family protein [Streptomyces sp. NPDC021212]|uniref:TIGR02679 family protein n=1 Tax=Streptomyces sp. NPDC021212 TaxID=3365118 RepID=UPI0037AA7988
MTAKAECLAEPLRSYLAHPSLRPVWTAARARMERNRLTPVGSVQLTLNEEAAHRLAGLLGTPAEAGTHRLSLKRLDEALRVSAAACGLLTALADLTGSPLHDRTAAREQRQAERNSVWQYLDTELARARLAHTTWAGDWIDALRASRFLSRATPKAAISAVTMAVETLRTLPALAGTAPQTGGQIRELAELAAVVTNDAHGLDGGTLTAALVLQAIATALDQPAPTTTRERRHLWEQAGITTDLLSGTVLTWHLDPPGDAPWPTMLRQRTKLGLATHLTVQELRSPAAAQCPLIRPGQRVYACENPQVLQAALRHTTAAPLVCTSGNPSHAAWILLERLIADGVDIVYHGDFDWPGIAIATRIYTIGAHPWRMHTSDYRAALRNPTTADRLPLAGTALPTPWDPALSQAMQNADTVVHEESQLPCLLADMNS